MSRSVFVMLASIILFMAVEAGIVVAQDFDRGSTGTGRDHDFDEMDRRIKALEALMGEVEEEYCDDVWEDVSSQGWTQKIVGRAEFDYVNFAQSDSNFGQVYFNDPTLGPQNYSEFRRLRIGVGGKGYGVYEYKFSISFSGESDGRPLNELKDVWIGIHHVPGVEFLRFGQDVTCIGLERLTSSKYITFMERSMATNFFVPDRRVGLQQIGQYANDSLLLENGVFFGGEYQALKEHIADQQGLVWTSRAVWTPIYENDGRNLLHIGAGWNFNYDREFGFDLRPNTNESVQTIRLGDRMIANANIGNTELAANYGRFSFQNELFAGNFRQEGGQSYNVYGGYAFATMFLTGETRTYKRSTGSFDRIHPLTNFWLVDTCQGCDAGWGAWELALRWDYIDLSDVPFDAANEIGGLENNLTLGLNWYWNPYVHWMFEYVHAAPFTHRAGNPGLASETDILAMRMHADW